MTFVSEDPHESIRRGRVSRGTAHRQLRSCNIRVTNRPFLPDSGHFSLRAAAPPRCAVPARRHTLHTRQTGRMPGQFSSLSLAWRWQVKPAPVVPLSSSLPSSPAPPRPLIGHPLWSGIHHTRVLCRRAEPVARARMQRWRELWQERLCS